jgi:hypothetical protein
MCLVICIYRGSLVGIPISSVFLHIIWVDMALIPNSTTNRLMVVKEYILLFAAYFLHYGISIWYLYYAWDW